MLACCRICCGRFRDRPSRALPLTCPKVKNLQKQQHKQQKIQIAISKKRKEKIRESKKREIQKKEFCQKEKQKQHKKRIGKNEKFKGVKKNWIPKVTLRLSGVSLVWRVLHFQKHFLCFGFCMISAFLQKFSHTGKSGCTYSSSCLAIAIFCSCLFDFQLCLPVEVLFGNKVSNIVEPRKLGHVGEVLTCMWS